MPSESFNPSNEGSRSAGSKVIVWDVKVRVRAKQVKSINYLLYVCMCVCVYVCMYIIYGIERGRMTVVLVVRALFVFVFVLLVSFVSLFVVFHSFLMIV